MILPVSCILFFYTALFRFQLISGVIQFCFSEFCFLVRINIVSLLFKPCTKHFLITHGLAIKDDHALTRGSFRLLYELFAVNIDHVLVNHNRLAFFIIICPFQRKSLTQAQTGMKKEAQFVTSDMNQTCLTGMLCVFLWNVCTYTFFLIPCSNITYPPFRRV